jgi:lysozyme family protein
MRDNFEQSFAATIKHEGGYVDHPKDPGGATNLGITIGTLSGWLGRPATKAEVKALTVQSVKPIYRKNYWDAVKGNDLPSGVDFAVYDFAVNSGPFRAAAYLQTIVGTAPDGKIGPLTIKAVEAYCGRFGAAQLVSELCSHRLAFLQQLSTWPTFGKGWGARVAGVRKEATAMASATPPKHPIDLPDTPEPAAPAKRKTLVDLLRGLVVRQATNHVVSTLKENGMNSNLIHNLLNIAIAIVAVLSLPEVTAILPPELGVVIAGGIGVLKTIINLFRDGPTGLVKQQPPVR